PRARRAGPRRRPRRHRRRRGRIMTTGNGKPTTDLFDRIEEEAAKNEAQRILAMSDAELDAELRENKLDPATVRAKKRALGEQLAKKAAHAKRVKLAKMAAMAVVVAAVLAVTAYVLTRGPKEHPLPQMPGPTAQERPLVARPTPTPG